MNIILLNENDWLAEQVALLRDHRADHIRGVLRASAGDKVRVGVLGGNRGTAIIEAIDEHGVKLLVEATEPPPPRHNFDIVLALPRPKMLRRILRTVAEFGVAHLHLINSARVEKSYWQSPLLHPEKISEALITGLERSMDTVLPEVHVHKRFRPFVEDELTGICAGRRCWIADMNGTTSLADKAREPAVVLIGPEGGFVPFEATLAESVIAERVHLGGRILSVDTALPAVLAQALPRFG
ncbi:16S rRNA (uracil(1498)-N(3))-methyltransferase [Synechococcus sp. FGCU-3]|nr:16S rRNA (uracil(1498)-N(3))-methyltransferase [Synechococcus sp. FGCU3]